MAGMCDAMNQMAAADALLMAGLDQCLFTEVRPSKTREHCAAHARTHTHTQTGDGMVPGYRGMHSSGNIDIPGDG